jgi:hypothetical protein
MSTAATLPASNGKINTSIEDSQSTNS